MTRAYFSPSLKSFIPSEWKDDGTYNDDTWPSDAVPVTEAEAASYWKQMPPDGQRLGVVDGRPAWEDEPALTPAQRTALAEQQKAMLRTQAQSTISLWQTELQLDIISDEDKTRLIAWMKYIQALNTVDTTVAEIVWPEKPFR
ncbi:tail fiber assembly protein [Erwinia psidii]|uniref:Phage tail protein n=1 Tax=Erwinia psidii TaxID=69224 RepID=A0A3N6SH38_9GAMM|nr:tail fiber assembly protein [Erwinia psidii]RQM36856.1 phage tail protein [Erwinia psidii]